MFHSITKMKTLLLASYLLLLNKNCKAGFQSTLSKLSEETLAEDGKLNFTQLTSKYGHKAEEHEVITEDGYIITVFHLPGKRHPVLLLHGLIDSADIFVVRGHSSGAITLADAGYDVWVGNVRGNKYGRRHIKLNPDKDMEFWDFTFHEIGYYDLPAMIDYVRVKTGEERISTIGHSQGTTIHWVLGSTRPEYNSKIKIFIALGPAAFFKHVKPPFSLLFEIAPLINNMIPKDIQELFQSRRTVSNLVKFICSKGVISYHLCTLGLILPLVGYNPKSYEPDFLRTMIGHYPSGASRKTFLHFTQLYVRGSFGQYDHGCTENLVKYGSIKPPDYDLSAISMKVALLAGRNDLITTLKDSEHLRDLLPNVVLHKVMKPRLWNHLDFVLGAGMPKHLYPTIFKLLEMYNDDDTEDGNSISKEKRESSTQNDLNTRTQQYLGEEVKLKT